MAEQGTRKEINRLYWGSEDSVAAIADRLGVSRRALYDSIDPRPAGTDCPRCGGALVFRNRTMVEKGEADCAECGSGHVVGAAPEPGAASSGRARKGAPAAAAAEPAAAGVEPEVEQEFEARRLSPVRAVPATGNGAALGGALLAGLAVGAAAGFLLRRG